VSQGESWPLGLRRAWWRTDNVEWTMGLVETTVLLPFTMGQQEHHGCRGHADITDEVSLSPRAVG